MQPAQDTLLRARVIVLDKLTGNASLTKFFSLIGFKKKTAMVFKNTRLDADDIRNFCLNKIHEFYKPLQYIFWSTDKRDKRTKNYTMKTLCVL